MISPFLTTVVRPRNRPPGRASATFRKLQRKCARNESIWMFLHELLLFGLLAAVSAWSVARAIEALRFL